MNNDDLRDELLLLVGFLLTSAHGLADEPKSYGPTRLLDTAGRVLGIMDKHSMLDDSLKGIKNKIDRERFGSMDDERLINRIDELALEWTEFISDRF